MVVQQNMAQSKSNPIIAQPSQQDLVEQVVEAHQNKSIPQKMALISKCRAQIQT